MEVRIAGLSASPGIAVGKVTLIRDVELDPRLPLPPRQEKIALEKAIAAALREIQSLVETHDGNEAEILDFQRALLEDETLTENVWPAIHAGVSADQAWRMALDQEIEAYQCETNGDASQENFAARAADLCDIRDRVLSNLFEKKRPEQFTSGEVIVAHDVLPSVFLSKDWSAGGALVLGAGSPLSHVAMLARARSIPMIVGIGDHWKKLAGEVVVDADDAHVTLNPQASTLVSARQNTALPAAKNTPTVAEPSGTAFTLDGTKISIQINVASIKDIANFDSKNCDGIGLTRTEFFIADALNDEERQYELYTQLLHWAGAKPVTIRTIDAGGDKPMAGYTVAAESNPFLGMRGIRLSLSRVDIFKIQLRALLRAAVHGHLKIMLPMVTLPSDLEKTRTLIEICADELKASGYSFAKPKLGIMVEVPAVALTLESFDADFYSIGTNDLTQYATAASRDNIAVSRYADTLNPGVLYMIAKAAQIGREHGKEVSICGDSAASEDAIQSLLNVGITSLSVPPSLVASIKAAIGNIRLSGARE